MIEHLKRIFAGQPAAQGLLEQREPLELATAALLIELARSDFSESAAELDAKVDEVVQKLAAKLPQTTRYAKQQMNFWRALSWHETVNHARDWLALSMLGDEAQEAVHAFLARSERKEGGAK